MDPKSPFIRSQVERQTGTLIKPFTPSPPSKLIQLAPTNFSTGQSSEPLRKIIKKITKEKPELFQTQIPKPKQEGGRVEAGRPYIVGEVGKELFVPDAGGKIVPNDDLPSSNLLVINKEPETVVVPQVTGSGGSSDTPIASKTVNAYDVVAKYAQMTGLFTV